jgi:lycopene beta-cyclase
MDADVVVIGAGAAGSHLMRAFAARADRLHVLLVDQSGSPTHGRRWGSWTPIGRTDPLASGPRARRVTVAGAGGVLVRALHEHEYQIVDGNDLGAAADDALRALGGERVTAVASTVHDDGGAAVVTTSAGDVRAPLVLDSVGLEVDAGPPAAWLDFRGMEVVTDGPAFDPGTVTLMDFRVPQWGEAAFGYVLPLTAHRALVELTAFAAAPGSEPWRPADQRAADVRAFVSQVVGADAWHLVGREAGSLPLRLPPLQRRHGRTLHVGRPGGLLKASSGYGYEYARRDAAAVAASVLTTGGGVPTPIGLHRRRRHRAMDAVFLELARTAPGSLVPALEQLFARNPADRVLRFLDERSTLAEEARLVASLPAGPFLSAARRLGPHSRVPVPSLRPHHPSSDPYLGSDDH